MKGQLSIFAIYKNWITVQNKKTGTLVPRPITKVLSNFSVVKKKQIQEGWFHLFVRGFNSYSIFYDIEDRVHFLLILDEEAKRVGAKISAFILMDNHFHLQVFTSQLSCLMKVTLHRYSVRFRRKYGFDGPVFKKAFGRSQIFSSLLVKENMLYILSNASRENICATHRDYIWSSYNSHPEVIRLRKMGMLPLLSLVPLPALSALPCQAPLPIPKRGRGPLPSVHMIAQNDVSQILKVDVSLMVSSFKDLDDLDYSIHAYVPLKNRMIDMPAPDSQAIESQAIESQAVDSQAIESQFIDGRKCVNSYRLTPDYEVIALFMDLLNGRKFSMISNYERSQIIHKLKKEKGATRRQISSILRIKY